MFYKILNWFNKITRMKMCYICGKITSNWYPVIQRKWFKRLNKWENYTTVAFKCGCNDHLYEEIKYR
jgi:hypothetical protein